MVYRRVKIFWEGDKLQKNIATAGRDFIQTANKHFLARTNKTSPILQSWWWPPYRWAPAGASSSCCWSLAPSWSFLSPDWRTAPQRQNEPTSQRLLWSSFLPGGLSVTFCRGKESMNYHYLINYQSCINPRKTGRSLLLLPKNQQPVVLPCTDISGTFLSLLNLKALFVHNNVWLKCIWDSC